MYVVRVLRCLLVFACPGATENAGQENEGAKNDERMENAGLKMRDHQKTRTGKWRISAGKLLRPILNVIIM